MATARIQPLSAHLHGVHRPSGGDPVKKLVYTVWMQSLVFNGHGCTIYDRDGCVAYRVDNYACRRRREVFVMDSGGRTLTKLVKENFGVFRTWQGYSASQEESGGQGQPWFTVEKEYMILKKKERRAVVRVAASGKVYRIDGAAHKSEYRVSDAADGEVVAEMRRKQTPSGVALGEDVMTLTVRSEVDRLLVVGLVVVCGLLA